MKTYYINDEGKKFEAEVPDGVDPNSHGIGARCQEPGCVGYLVSIDRELWTEECNALHVRPMPDAFVEVSRGELSIIRRGAGDELITREDLPWSEAS